MKITLLTSIYPHKAISDYSDHLIRAFLKKNIELEIITFKNIYPEFLYPGGTTDTRESADYQGVIIKRIIKWHNPFSWRKAAREIRGNILLLEWWTVMIFPIYFLIMLVTKRKKIPIILSLHNILPHESKILSRFFIKIILSLSDYYIVHNQNNKNKLISLFSIIANKIKVIPIGIYGASSYQIINPIKARKELKLNEDNKYLLFYGAIRKYKGLDTLLKAMPKILNKQPKVKLIIAGTVWGNFNKYQKIINNQKIDKYIITYLHYLSNNEISQLASAAQAIILPYKYFDASSGLVKGALFFEKPLIATRVGDLPDIIDNKNYLAAPNNINDLADKIIYLLDHPNETNKLVADLKNNKVKFDWDKIALQFKDLFHAI